MKIDKNIDISKLKIKYVLGIQSELENYPTPEDILYELIYLHLSKNTKNIKFSSVDIIDKYSIDEDKFNVIIDSLLKDNYISIVNESNNKIIYEIINNPFN